MYEINIITKQRIKLLYQTYKKKRNTLPKAKLYVASARAFMC